ncbi:MAG: hypothetical protein JSV52_00150 [Candidatus Zixiibacteriota bacterium]|nr:MAG: hypothetical protein JSV52_00150 [candidate division Zixibacteria bacterium]
MKLTTSKTVALLCIAFVISAVNAGGQETSAGSLDGKIAFLRSGDVYVANIDGTDTTAVTHTGGKVKEFSFSPNLDYLAFIRSVDADWSEFEVFGLVVMDPMSAEILTEIPPGGEWPEMGQWVAFDKLIYCWSSGFDLAGFGTYEVTSKSRLDHNDDQWGYRLFFGEFTDDWSLMMYTTDSGLGPTSHDRLHIRNIATGEDRIVARKKTIRGFCMSHNKRYIGLRWSESSQPGTIHQFHILDLETDSLTRIYPSATVPSAYAGAAWSYGDSLISFIAGNEAVVISVSSQAEVGRIEGGSFSWCDDNRILFYRGGGIYIYDLVSKQEKLLVENAVQPVLLKAVQ